MFVIFFPQMSARRITSIITALAWLAFLASTNAGTAKKKHPTLLEEINGIITYPNPVGAKEDILLCLSPCLFNLTARVPVVAANIIYCFLCCMRLACSVCMPQMMV